MGRTRRDSPRTGAAPTSAAVRTCAGCGRTITWRRSWARDWEQVRWCSQRCRRRRVAPVDEALAAAILDLLDTRPPSASICPSEAARRVAGDDPGAWRPLMEPARAAARRLVAAGEVEVTQRGRVVDPSRARGPIRVRRVQPRT